MDVQTIKVQVRISAPVPIKKKRKDKVFVTGEMWRTVETGAEATLKPSEQADWQTAGLKLHAQLTAQLREMWQEAQAKEPAKPIGS